ncbi:MAG: hypothetical protein K5649_03895 [Lachnospiraceae bacterium]|nr:hypothetical protein [Lachnospiraceae bacterium]
MSVKSQPRYTRNSNIINRKFYQFLIPTILSTVAISLNEFVDSIVVAQLLGSDAMSMVGMGSPIMLAYAVLYTMFGMGGAIIYAEYAGKQEQKKADQVFSVVFATVLIVSVLCSVSGMILIDPVSALLCKNETLLPVFKPYLRVLFLSGIFIIPIQMLINFFPSFGKPKTGTVLNITANGINLLMDYVYIRYFATDLKGAAMATMTGYVAVTVILLILCIFKKIVLPLRRIRKEALAELPSVITRGIPASISQLGFCIKIFFCNQLAAGLGGTDGVSIFTLCMQSVSIVSIAIAGVVCAMMPLVSALRGQRDFEGIRMLMKRAMRDQFIASVFLTLLFEAYPQMFLKLYNFSGSGEAGAILGLRIFSLMFIFRNFVLVFMYYFQVVARKAYSSAISITDGFAGVIPLALLFTHFYGINGLWITFPALAVLMLAGILCINAYLSARSNGKYRGLMLIETETEDVKVYDSTVLLDRDAVSDAAYALQQFCREHLAESELSVLVCLSCEEMLDYTAENADRHSGPNAVDVLVKIYPEEIQMDFRSTGRPLDPLAAAKDAYSNVGVLKKVATLIEYNYVMSMNQTRIHLKRTTAALPAEEADQIKDTPDA